MATERMEMNGISERESGEEVSAPRRRRDGAGPLNMNHYANKKSAAESMLDVALLMANASQLKAVMEQGPDFTFYTTLITLISISLSLQIIVGILLIFIVKWNLNDESMHFKLNILENIATALVFIIVVGHQLLKRSENFRDPVFQASRLPVTKDRWQINSTASLCPFILKSTFQKSTNSPLCLWSFILDLSQLEY
ncbi:hypothetical protein DPEC_G00197540 [Dallia pectoralis]|uniref:Uncharacterized protein n=1 Tax=Dallia pectoralis TaxID=75939 RepID=A0ACC2G7X4_DALPE|nr:hypothetical protein DPEC_G00197540 [Dallia pectoralis]